MNDGILKSSIILRMTLVAVLSLALLIPSFIIMGTISEREAARNTAMSEISDKWGNPQTFTGPSLSIPYKRNGDQHDIDQLHIFPDSLAITANAIPEIRSRGIYQAVLYTAKVTMNGTFSVTALPQHNINPGDLLWKEAALAFGISDTKGIRDIAVTWEKVSVESEPGVVSNEFLRKGITIHPTLSPQQHIFTFTANFTLNGSTDLQFVPVGKQTSVSISSPWSDPSFVGRYLPEQRTISAAGFSASWKLLQATRGFAQQWVGTTNKPDTSLADFAFGVRLIQTVDEYQKTMRSAKYAIMFISLTFLSFFLTEVLAKKAIHPIQYALVGLALVLFYCLLLSLSEHISFNAAYLASSVGTILIVAGYARSVLGSRRFAAIVSGVLTLLYGFLFVILQLEDYALLFGSLGLFAILASIMYLTRKIDWFSVGKEPRTQTSA